MNGSRNPDDPTDEMCPTCGLYYSRRGIIPHSRHCDRDEPLLDPTRDEIGTHAVEDAPTPTPSDGDGATPSPDHEAATDGGTTGLGLPGPPATASTTPSDDAVDEQDVEDGTTDPDGCPECGCPDWWDADALAEHPDVDDDKRAILASNDRVCTNCNEAY